MAQSSENLNRLARELAQLDPVDRAQVVAEAARLKSAPAKPRKFLIPTLRGGTGWIGGELGREGLYDDDGR